ncbi:MAG: asparaginase [Phascolarctobacterium sp.]|nr:asparaginase [Phascolarctobacterium sp.]
MKKVLMLGTGGTIACVPSADGLVPALDGPAMIRVVPELEEVCAIETKQILNLDSSNLAPEHWRSIAEAVAANYTSYDGFVITHGTDTMAYTAAALSQMLCNCQKPVVLTGAQLPIQAEGSDAPNNIYHAFLAATSPLKGVALVFGDLVIHGAHAKKLYTQDFNGFASINREPLATISHNHLFWQKGALQGGGYGEGEFSINTQLEIKIAVVKIIPGATPDILDYYVAKGYKGLIIEGFGAGGVPNGDNNWLPKLEQVLQQGIRVVCATQCLYDGVHLNTYPMGILAERLGAQSAGLDTLETSVVKLMQELAQ